MHLSEHTIAKILPRNSHTNDINKNALMAACIDAGRVGLVKKLLEHIREFFVLLVRILLVEQKLSWDRQAST